MILYSVPKLGWVTTDPALVSGGREVKVGDYFGVKDGSVFLLTSNGPEVVAPEHEPDASEIVPAKYYDVIESKVVSAPSNADIR